MSWPEGHSFQPQLSHAEVGPVLYLTCRLSLLLQLFALQTESRDQRDIDEMVHHKLPVYVQNMDRLGDTELWDTNITVFTDDWLLYC